MQNRQNCLKKVVKSIFLDAIIVSDKECVMNNLNVYSEIGRLRKVLLHRPGYEIENLTPELMDRLLFDDIPYLEIAREEHDAFAKVFTDNGVEVVYLEDLVAEVLEEISVKEEFLKQFIAEAGLKGRRAKTVLNYYLNIENNSALVEKLIAGIRREEISLFKDESLASMVTADYPFIVDPMPNLYFTRDPFAVIGHGVSINRMATVTRNRETIFGDYVFKYHKDFMGGPTPHFYDRTLDGSIEGGDILVLNDKVVAVGISERTRPQSIELFAKNLFEKDDSFKTVLAFDIPKSRAFMHLDTVFTMVDHNKFTIHPEIEGPLSVYAITRKEEGLDIVKETMELDKILAKHLGVEEVVLIRCGGKKGIDAGREQWNDGSNTLAIAPGEVIVYSRNHVKNKLLEANGIKIHVIPSSELSRGRGGPRCMSMPLIRDSI